MAAIKQSLPGEWGCILAEDLVSGGLGMQAVLTFPASLVPPAQAASTAKKPAAAKGKPSGAKGKATGAKKAAKPKWTADEIHAGTKIQAQIRGFLARKHFRCGGASGAPWPATPRQTRQLLRVAVSLLRTRISPASASHANRKHADRLSRKGCSMAVAGK